MSGSVIFDVVYYFYVYGGCDDLCFLIVFIEVESVVGCIDVVGSKFFGFDCVFGCFFGCGFICCCGFGFGCCIFCFWSYIFL